MWVEYTVKGGHPADVRRALSKCVADAGAEMVGEPIIDVIEREKLPDGRLPVAFDPGQNFILVPDAGRS